jgi:hypothetical protein
VPHDVIAHPDRDRNRSLGWLANAWMEFFCVHGPGDVQGEPVVHGDEVAGFVVDCYALDSHGRRLHDSGFFSRPKGCDKSGLGARLAMFEALGPCRFAGWAKGGEIYEDPWGLGFRFEYAAGDPMGRPVKVPFIRIMATEEGQTGNVYDSIYYNLTDEAAPLALVPGVTCGLSRTLLPGGGEITPSTAGSASKDGGKETFVVFDETHLYKTPELRSMYRTVTRNLRKRKRIAGTWFLETTTMFAAGEESVAEMTYNLAEQIRENAVKTQRLVFDHRYGICEDLTSEEMLRVAILEAFGEAIDWNDIDAIVDDFYDTRNAPADSCRYWLNAVSGAVDAWLTEPEWRARVNVTLVVSRRDPIVLGFDGSRARARGVTDATALIACSVIDGHLFEPLERSVWEQPTGPAGREWQVPAGEVDAAVHECFRRYNVVGFFGDPAKWETYIASWEATYGSRLKVKARRDHPIEWWMTGGRAAQIVRALDEFHSAVLDGEMSHDGSYALTRHVLNARRRPTKSGLMIAKETPDSALKIDACVAAVLAWQARLAARAAGIGLRRTTGVPRRIR